ncbi:hypothetical protein KRM28CT15_22140 [Krasilnikovia sp. M28-CT-15]
MLVEPNCSQIRVSACAGRASAIAVSEPAVSRQAVRAARRACLMTLLAVGGGLPETRGMGALPMTLAQIEECEKSVAYWFPARDPV